MFCVEHDTDRYSSQNYKARNAAEHAETPALTVIMDASSNQLPKEPKELKLDLKASPSAPRTAGLDLVRPEHRGQALPLTCDYRRSSFLLPARPTTQVRYVSLFLNLRAEVHVSAASWHQAISSRPATSPHPLMRGLRKLTPGAHQIPIPKEN